MGELEAITYLLSCAGILLISQLSPGPDFILVVRAALNRGWRVGSWLGIGIGAGGLIHTVLYCLWGTWLLKQSWSASIVLAATAWLLYLAYKIFRSTCGIIPPHESDATIEGVGEQALSTQDSPRALFMQGFICNLLNVKFVLFIASIGMFGMESYAPRYSWYVLAFILTIGLVNSLGWVLWSRLFQWRPLRTFYKSHEAWIDRCFATLLAILAIVMSVNQFS